MVGFVICGLEHSGTTLVSELLRQVPGVDAGFEIGVLLRETPRDFPIFQPYALHVVDHWGITYETLLFCCDTDDFGVFYDRLQAAATVLRPHTHTIFDKTPRYLGGLKACMARAKVPFIVTCKDPRSTVYSDFKSSGHRDFDDWLLAYAAEKVAYMRLCYAEHRRVARLADSRVCLVRLEELCLDPRGTCTRLFAHVGYGFDLAYLSFRAARYSNTRVGSIAAGLPFEYRSGLGPWRSRQVAEIFAEFTDWFFE